jgi:hypothetical protein
VISFGRVMCLPLDHIPGGGQQLVRYSWIDGCAVGGDLGRLWGLTERAGDEPAGDRQIPLLGDQHVDDLAELVDRPVPADPPSRDLDGGLIHEPPIARVRQHGLAASINRRVNRCTHRKIGTWVSHIHVPRCDLAKHGLEAVAAVSAP